MRAMVFVRDGEPNVMTLRDVPAPEPQDGEALIPVGYSIIRSSVTGIVGKRRIEVGQNVSVGQDLIEVVSLDDVWITASFKEKPLANSRPGQPVEIKVDTYGRIWKGHLTNLGGGAGSVFSGPESEIGKRPQAIQRVAVRIDFDHPQSQDFNADDLLKPGLSVEPRVRVRWLPRSGPASKYSGSHGLTAWTINTVALASTVVPDYPGGSARTGWKRGAR